MAASPPPYPREKRDLIISLAFLQRIAEVKKRHPEVYRDVIDPLLEAVAESQEEIAGLGREYLALLGPTEEGH